MRKNNRKELDENKNREFIQFYRPYLDTVTRLALQKPGAYRVFMLLVKYMNNFNEFCMTTKAMAVVLETSQRTIQRNIKYLYEKGYIDKRRMHSNNVYIVNPSIAWINYANQKQKCRYFNSIRLDETEDNLYLTRREVNVPLRIYNDEMIQKYGEKGRK